MANELFAAIKGGDTKAVERLLDIDRGLVEARDETGLSPLLAALYRGRNDIAMAIQRRGPKLTRFDAGADPNARSESGGTPLHTTAFTGDRTSMELLLECGGDGSIKNEQGKTAADIARERGHSEIARLLEDRLTQR